MKDVSMCGRTRFVIVIARSLLFASSDLLLYALTRRVVVVDVIRDADSR
jgi:hypothetical protein